MKLTPLLRRLGLGRPLPNETSRQVTGRRGERAAERYLRKAKGYRTVTRNWRLGKGEIDLVCLDREVLVFVEVKTRAADARVPGYYAVNREKKKVLRRVFGAYLKQLRKRPRTFRFDIVEVSAEADGGLRVSHFENIPLFPKGYHWES